jgi:hypothetical protein
MRRSISSALAVAFLAWPAAADAYVEPEVVASGAKITAPQLVVDDRGAATIVWNDVGRGGVIYARSRQPGDRWSPPRVLSRRGGDVTPQVALAPTGDVAVHWRLDGMLWVVRRLGDRWSGVHGERDPAGAGELPAFLGVDGFGNIHRLRQERTADFGRMLLAATRPFGGRWYTEQRVVNGDGSPFQVSDYELSGAEARLANGTWLQHRCYGSKCYGGVDTIRRFWDGSWRVDGMQIDGSGYNGGQCLTVAASQSGWSEITANVRPTFLPSPASTFVQLFVRRSGEAFAGVSESYGHSFPSHEFGPGPLPPDCPSVATGDLGHAVIAIRGEDAPGRVTVVERAPDGSFTAPLAISDGARRAGPPVTGMSGRGDVAVAWISTTADGTRSRIDGRTRAAAKRWSSLRLIMAGAPTGQLTGLDAGVGAGLATFAWRQTVGSTTRLLTTDRWIASADRTPPLPARSLRGRRDSSGAVHLTWTASVSADVTGYRIYRGGSLLSATDRTTTWVDRTASPRRDTRYKVVAVDGGGNLARASAGTEVRSGRP